MQELPKGGLGDPQLDKGRGGGRTQQREVQCSPTGSFRSSEDGLTFQRFDKKIRFSYPYFNQSLDVGHPRKGA